ncbi:hypothetical protein BN903_13 [Halorubrum sp. AJ67]|nr:hypothetical protein BN903_13 [Halorubrum sp. AJ67]
MDRCVSEHHHDNELDQQPRNVVRDLVPLLCDPRSFRLHCRRCRSAVSEDIFSEHLL